MATGSARFPAWLVLLLATLSSSGAAQHQDAAGMADRPDYPRAVAFFHDLRAALARDDREAIADMMEYPFLTSVGHKKVHISTRAKFLQHFNEVFDNGVRCEIARATDADVWGNWQGFTIDDGAIWFDDILPRGEKIDPKSPEYWTRGKFQVITVNNDSYYPCSKSGSATQ
jgi:hypothetical protein